MIGNYRGALASMLHTFAPLLGVAAGARYRGDWWPRQQKPGTRQRKRRRDARRAGRR